MARTDSVAADASDERRQRRHERTRREILRAAREVLLEAGVDGLTVRDVAERADFSPAAAESGSDYFVLTGLSVA